eukprot:364362-Chlamydomonas_euryale.AAC.20
MPLPAAAICDPQGHPAAPRPSGRNRAHHSVAIGAFVWTAWVRAAWQEWDRTFGGHVIAIATPKRLERFPGHVSLSAARTCQTAR